MSYRLNVPYREKDDAKRKGARWNPYERYWYCEELTEDLRRWYEEEEELDGAFNGQTGLATLPCELVLLFCVDVF